VIPRYQLGHRQLGRIEIFLYRTSATQKDERPEGRRGRQAQDDDQAICHGWRVCTIGELIFMPDSLDFQQADGRAGGGEERSWL